MESSDGFGLLACYIGSFPADCEHWRDSSDCVSCVSPFRLVCSYSIIKKFSTIFTKIRLISIKAHSGRLPTVPNGPFYVVDHTLFCEC